MRLTYSLNSNQEPTRIHHKRWKRRDSRHLSEKWHLLLFFQLRMDSQRHRIPTQILQINNRPMSVRPTLFSRALTFFRDDDGYTILISFIRGGYPLALSDIHDISPSSLSCRAMCEDNETRLDDSSFFRIMCFFEFFESISEELVVCLTRLGFVKGMERYRLVFYKELV